MVAVPRYVQGGAPGISADRLNQPFELKTAQYDAGNARVRCTIGAGRADFGGSFAAGVVEQTADATFDIPNPTINTTYYVYLTALGFTYDTIGHAKAGFRIARLVMGATLADPVITDVRGIAPIPPRAVVADWDPGVRNRNSLKVSQRAAGANMTVDVAAGPFVVAGADGNISTQSDAIMAVTGFTAPSAGLQRYDLVGVRMSSAGYPIFERIAGTAAASPTVPAFPANELILAIVGPILNSTTSITNSMIHDAHTGTGPTEVATVRLVAGFRDRPGTTKETYATVADSGWVMEYGQELDRTVFAALFAEIGTQHGAGNGTTTFNAPNSRGRVAVAADNMGGTDAGVLTSANALGTKGGEESHLITLAEVAQHSHTGPSHFHDMGHDHPAANTSTESNYHTHQIADTNGFRIGYYNSMGSGPLSTYVPVSGLPPSGIWIERTGNQEQLHTHQFDVPAFSGNTGAAGTGNTGNAGSNTPHNNMQPFITVNRMIRT